MCVYHLSIFVSFAPLVHYLPPCPCLPSLVAVLIHLNSADVTTLLAGMLAHVPKANDKAKGKEPTGRAPHNVIS